MRPYYDLRYRLFANVALLKHRDSRALVHFIPKSNAINIVVASLRSPQDFLRVLVGILEKTVSVLFRRETCTRRLCPRCIQGVGIYSTVAHGETSSNCTAGHLLTQQDVSEGVLWEKHSWCRNAIWTGKVPSLCCYSFLFLFFQSLTPITFKQHETFYTSGDWRHGERLKRTELSSLDTNEARMKEYCRVRDMFYHFVREDSVRTFELDRIVFIDNLDLESRFQCFFEKCFERFMLATSIEEPAHVVSQQNENPIRKQWRRFVQHDMSKVLTFLSWVLDHFEAYQERRAGNGAVNMVPAWHGMGKRRLQY